MKAKLLVGMAGEPMRSPGDNVEGNEAVRLIEAGYAVPVVEDFTKEVAAMETIATERKGRKKSVAKETR